MAPKEKWGTIVKCRFPLGYQKMTDYELQQSVDRLARNETKHIKPWWEEERKETKGTPEMIDRIVSKLTLDASLKASDAQRIAKGPLLKMGVVNSFAWKGYN